MAYHVPKSPDLPILAFLMIFYIPRLIFKQCSTTWCNLIER